MSAQSHLVSSALEKTKGLINVMISRLEGLIPQCCRDAEDLRTCQKRASFGEPRLAIYELTQLASRVILARMEAIPFSMEMISRLQCCRHASVSSLPLKRR